MKCFKEIDPRLVAHFMRFHKSHGIIFKNFVRYARLLKSSGHKRHSAWAIINKIRWDHAIKKIDEFKINNDFIALYARLAMARHKDLRGFFVVKSTKACGRKMSFAHRAKLLAKV